MVFVAGWSCEVPIHMAIVFIPVPFNNFWFVVQYKRVFKAVQVDQVYLLNDSEPKAFEFLHDREQEGCFQVSFKTTECRSGSHRLQKQRQYRSLTFITVVMKVFIISNCVGQKLLTGIYKKSDWANNSEVYPFDSGHSFTIKLSFNDTPTFQLRSLLWEPEFYYGELMDR